MLILALDSTAQVGSVALCQVFPNQLTFDELVLQVHQAYRL